MTGEKRPANEQPLGNAQLVKRQRSSTNLNDRAVTAYQDGPAPPQTVMQLSGHSGEIFTARFDPSGNHIASGSMDHTITLWRTSGDYANYGLISGHKKAVLELQWTRDSQKIYSASADRTICSWDVETGQRTRQHTGHTDITHAVDLGSRGEQMFVSGSNDCHIGIWDARKKTAVDFINDGYSVLAVCLSADGKEVYSAGIDEDIKVWDLRTRKLSYKLEGHTDSVLSLELSPDQQWLLSNSFDNTVRTWDVRPFGYKDRQLKVFDGATAGPEQNTYRASWDKDGTRVAAGGGDGTCTVWETRTGKMVHKLPGHKGSVNDVHINPAGNMILTASTDRTMLLGELPTRNTADFTNT